MKKIKKFMTLSFLFKSYYLKELFSYWLNEELIITRKEIFFYLFLSILFASFHIVAYNLSTRDFFVYSAFGFAVLILFGILFWRNFHKAHSKKEDKN